MSGPEYYPFVRMVENKRVYGTFIISTKSIVGFRMRHQTTIRNIREMTLPRGAVLMCVWGPKLRRGHRCQPGGVHRIPGHRGLVRRVRVRGVCGWIVVVVCVVSGRTGVAGCTGVVVSTHTGVVVSTHTVAVRLVLQRTRPWFAVPDAALVCVVRRSVSPGMVVLADRWICVAAAMDAIAVRMAALVE